MNVNKDMQALNADGEPIEGLYAIGNCAGNFFGSPDYPMTVPGLSLGRCHTRATSSAAPWPASRPPLAATVRAPPDFPHPPSITLPSARGAIERPVAFLGHSLT